MCITAPESQPEWALSWDVMAIENVTNTTCNVYIPSYYCTLTNRPETQQHKTMILLCGQICELGIRKGDNGMTSLCSETQKPQGKMQRPGMFVRTHLGLESLDMSSHLSCRWQWPLAGAPSSLWANLGLLGVSTWVPTVSVPSDQDDTLDVFVI